LRQLHAVLFDPALHGDTGEHGIIMQPTPILRWEGCPAFIGCGTRDCTGCLYLPLCADCQGEGQNAYGEDCETCGGEGRTIPT